MASLPTTYELSSCYHLFPITCHLQAQLLITGFAQDSATNSCRDKSHLKQVLPR